jgi:hypothetical protein
MTRTQFLTRAACPFLILALLAGCSTPPAITTTSPESAVPSYYVTYTAEDNLFSVSYPPGGWGPEQDMLAESEAAVKALIASRNENKLLEQASLLFVGGLPPSYLPTIIVLAEPLLGGITTQEQLVTAKMESFKAAGSNFKELVRTDTTIDGRQATIIEYSAILGGTSRHDVVSFFIDGNEIWSVTAAALQQNYQQYKDDLYHIARSLKVKGKG